MTYEKIIQTISNIVDNDQIYKEGLTLVYELDEIKHRQLDEELCIKLTGGLVGFEHQEVFEIELGGILVKFIKKGAKFMYDLES